MQVIKKTLQLVGINVFFMEKEEFKSRDEIVLQSIEIPGIQLPKDKFTALTSMKGWRELAKVIKDSGVKGTPQTYTMNFHSFRMSDLNIRSDIYEASQSNTLKLNNTRGKLSALLKDAAFEWLEKQDESVKESGIAQGWISQKKNSLNKMGISHIDVTTMVGYYPMFLNDIFEIPQLRQIEAILYQIRIGNIPCDAITLKSENFIETDESGNLTAALSHFEGKLSLPEAIRRKKTFKDACDFYREPDSEFGIFCMAV